MKTFEFRFFIIFYQLQGISYDQAGISFTRECFAARFVEIGSVDLEKKIFKNHHCIFTTSLLSPEGNEKNFLLPGCQVWLKLTQWLWQRVVNLYVLCCFYTLLTKSVIIIFEHESSSPGNDFCLAWCKKIERTLRLYLFSKNETERVLFYNT